MDGQQNNQNGWNGSEAPRTYGEDTKMYQNRQNAPQQPKLLSKQPRFPLKKARRKRSRK